MEGMLHTLGESSSGVRVSAVMSVSLLEYLEQSVPECTRVYYRVESDQLFTCCYTVQCTV